MNEIWVFSGIIVLYIILTWKAEKIFPIIYLFAFTYFLQYIFSTYLIYNEYKILSYQMPIKQTQYFNYVVPALISLFAGVLIFNKDVDIRYSLRKINSGDAARLGYLLLTISLFFDLAKLLNIGVIDSLLSFTLYLKYLAAFCFLFTGSYFNYVFIVLIYTQLAFTVLMSGVFISFFIWTAFLLFFITIKYSISFWVRVVFFITFIPVIVLIQSVKTEYRNTIRKQESKGGLNLFSDLVEKQNSRDKNDPFAQSTGVVSTVGRLSQGWHLGLTLKQVPSHEPIANGQEILLDITSSLLPRILYSEKKEVNSQAKFFKYTGHKLKGATSMSIGILGDFYINFGWWGSIVMLFVFGSAVASFLRYFITRFVIPDPINIVWVPFLLCYLVRANNDFYIFFNCLVKGFLIFLAVDYIRYKLLGVNRPSQKAANANIF
jgi:hypothetical protein